jgi:hypothetical protein
LYLLISNSSSDSGRHCKTPSSALINQLPSFPDMRKEAQEKPVFVFHCETSEKPCAKKKKKKISFVQMQTLPMSILPLRYFSSYSNILGTCILFFMEAEREKYSFEIMKDNQKRIIKLLFLLSWNS